MGDREGANCGICALRSQPSIRVGLHHGACRQAFGLAGRQVGGVSRRPQPKRLAPTAFHPSAALPAGREAAVGASVAARNQIRRLSHGGAYRRWTGATLDSHRARLDRQISKRHCRAREPQHQDCLHRWELWGLDEAGLPTFAQTQAATDGQRNVGSATRCCPSHLTPYPQDDDNDLARRLSPRVRRGNLHEDRESRFRHDVTPCRATAR